MPLKSVNICIQYYLLPCTEYEQHIDNEPRVSVVVESSL